jgi:hypothetical protein
VSNLQKLFARGKLAKASLKRFKLFKRTSERGMFTYQSSDAVIRAAGSQNSVSSTQNSENIENEEEDIGCLARHKYREAIELELYNKRELAKMMAFS